MLLKWFPKLKENKIIQLINEVFYSKYYIIAVGLLVFLCHGFSFEIPLFYLAVIVGIVIPSLLCEDLISLVAPLAMFYSSISLRINSVHMESSLFGGANKIHLIVLVTLIFLFVLGRLVFDIYTNKERRVRPALLLGYIFLAPCFILGGLFSSYWKMDTILYGLVVFLSLSGVYFILLYIIDWKKVPKDYYAWLVTVYGLVVAFEVFFIVLKIKAGHTEYISTQDQIFTGWGMRNNIAGQIVICMAGPIYLAYKSSKFTLLYLTFPFIMLVGILLTNSRGGTVVGLLILIASLVAFAILGKKIQKFELLGVLCAAAIATAIVFIVKKEEMYQLFARFFDSRPDISDIKDFTQGRNVTWEHGLEHFKESSLFGVGFYQCKDYRFENFSTSFIPARYHNIYIQLLASTGVMGFAAYIYHRYQTLVLTFKKPTIEKIMIYMTIVGIVFCSFVDNTFFNLGPGLNYCIALAFIEGINISEKSI